MPNSKLSEAERIELFRKLACQFEQRDRQYAKEIQHYVNAVLESDTSRDLNAIEIALFAKEALEFAAQLHDVIGPFRHSVDWMGFASRLVSVTLNSAMEVRRIAEASGVEMEDPEAIGDLKKTAQQDRLFDEFDFDDKRH